MSFLFGSSKTTDSSTTPTLTGPGQTLFDQLSKFGNGVISDPSAGLGPIKTAGMEQINNSYGNIPQIISKQMAERGYGSSGSMGDTMYKTNLSRLGSLSQFNGQMASLASNRQFSAADMMDRMLGTQVGQNGHSVTKTVDPMAAFKALGSVLMMTLAGEDGGMGGGGEGPSMSDLQGLPSRNMSGNTNLMDWGGIGG